MCIVAAYEACDGYLYIIDYPLAADANFENIPTVNATLYDLTPADLSSPFDATCSPTLLDGVQAAFGPLVSNYTAVIKGLPDGPVLQAFNSSAPSVTLFAVSNDDIGYADLYRTYTVGELLPCSCAEVPI